MAAHVRGKRSAVGLLVHSLPETELGPRKFDSRSSIVCPPASGNVSSRAQLNIAAVLHRTVVLKKPERAEKGTTTDISPRLCCCFEGDVTFCDLVTISTSSMLALLYGNPSISGCPLPAADSQRARSRTHEAARTGYMPEVGRTRKSGGLFHLTIASSYPETRLLGGSYIWSVWTLRVPGTLFSPDGTQF